MSASTATARGALVFARFAYPPNQLGYCGPDIHDELLQRVHRGVAGAELRALLRNFDGAWPYLQLIAAANRIRDPLDERVVEAYWIGNSLLDRVDQPAMATSLLDRFSPRLARAVARDGLLDPVSRGALPHHGFHVFGVYPWVGLLRAGTVTEPLHVLDQCRVRWGRVVGLGVGHATVVSRPLLWSGSRLLLGSPRPETVTVAHDGYRLAPRLRIGDWCALHWGWLCQPLDRRQLVALQSHTHRQLAAVNGSSRPAPAYVLS